MLNWFQALLPKEGKFFDLFDAHAVTLCAGARSLQSLASLNTGSRHSLSCRVGRGRERIGPIWNSAFTCR